MPKRPPKTVTLHQGGFIKLVRRGRWEFAQRTKTTGIVMIVPITDKGELVMIEQFRPALNKTIIELPAGLAGDIEGTENEALVVAARRELYEETGYTAARMKRITQGPPSAGLSDEVITLFLATGLKKTGEGEGDGHEQITTHRIRLPRVESWLRKRESETTMIDLKIWSGLYFAGKHFK